MSNLALEYELVALQPFNAKVSKTYFSTEQYGYNDINTGAFRSI
ncbi:hypothetical protein SAMN05421545_3290 [Pontibacter lucknowensis]|uniref:Uncharacterized protein n=1 Tax=Pontibacter lucknowensis TaxID=1077936 RepID=A0A1N7A829_9BACT|nr:hypothetical protein SAMN05421545_3290 [Pontibacter lucknowensis]